MHGHLISVFYIRYINNGLTLIFSLYRSSDQFSENAIDEAESCITLIYHFISFSFKFLKKQNWIIVKQIKIYLRKHSEFLYLYLFWKYRFCFGSFLPVLFEAMSHELPNYLMLNTLSKTD